MALQLVQVPTALAGSTVSLLLPVVLSWRRRRRPASGVVRVMVPAVAMPPLRYAFCSAV